MERQIIKQFTFNFKEFNKTVKTYYPLNKEKTRYLILFLNGKFAFYNYDIERRILIKCNN